MRWFVISGEELDGHGNPTGLEIVRVALEENYEELVRKFQEDYRVTCINADILGKLTAESYEVSFKLYARTIKRKVL